MNMFCILLAVLSIWEYPARHQLHRRLVQQFVMASRAEDGAKMEDACRKGVALLPENPTWHYNLACSLARLGDREDEATDELERAIDLGFRDRAQIEKDADLKRLTSKRRYLELLEYADFMRSRPLLTGPKSAIDATGAFGGGVVLGEHNLDWNFDVGCFVAKMKLSPGKTGGNVGDLYMNFDDMHSVLKVEGYPGLTSVTLDQEGRNRQLNVVRPNFLFPYPVFGNCSRAFAGDVFWRSIPRMMMTGEKYLLEKMMKFYLSNQTWVYPANADIAPIGTNGDVFASITPYWITTAGRSYSDLPYLRAALEASRTFKPDVKKEIVRRGLLAPTIQTLIRKALKGVTNEVDYLSAKAHPTAFPQRGLELARLTASASQMTEGMIPPLVVVVVKPDPVKSKVPMPEFTYGSSFAWAFVLRAEETERVFHVRAKGAAEYAFVKTHGEGVDVRIEREGEDAATIRLNRTGMSPTNRVDIAVFGRNPGTGWGAPSYVSFARMDSSAPYSDPVLTAVPQVKAK